MHERPDYDSARERAGFSWYASGSQDALRALTGVPIRDFNLDPEAVITAYREGIPKLRERFGDEVTPPGLATPHNSYGHVNGLGAEIRFPDGGELCLSHPYPSLEVALRRLREPVDWPTAGLAPFYLSFRERLQRAFPDQPVAFTYGLEGPLTTAYELRGDEFWLDIYDQPEQAKEFLRLLTASIVEFGYFLADVNGRPRVGPSAGMCDDLSSVIPARLFPEFVVPYWNQYFDGFTTGRRSAHVEDLRVDHLPFLEEIGLWHYDPSISGKLNPKLIREHCRVPFTWRLGSFHYLSMTPQDVRDFVFQAVADGASSVHTIVEQILCADSEVPKVLTFIAAAKEAKRLLSEGATRAEVGELVSPAGRERFWARFPE